jgi:hypothetical protein
LTITSHGEIKQGVSRVSEVGKGFYIGLGFRVGFWVSEMGKGFYIGLGFRV